MTALDPRRPDLLDDCPPVRVAALLAVAELLLNHLDRQALDLGTET